ncbi:MAG: hypothetical protein CMO61_12510 [Verrucomicrobiales bacterium]|nr:hypothetical protein [Verrucomicrobiales bacterium]|tara:strand:- start:12692 stop:14191 length:1500 start_codon:yes stop_codon:yes gene_type:complete
MEMRRKALAVILLAVISVVAAEEPAYQVKNLLSAESPTHSRSTEWKPGEGIAMEVSGMEWLGADTLAVSIRKGEVWLIKNALAVDPSEFEYQLFASGLHEPLGVTLEGKDLLVSQRAEITRLQDSNEDGVADAYLTECDGWNVSGNYHAYTYGPERDGEGNLWVTLNLGMGDLANNEIGWRGWGGIIGSRGEFIPKALGMRSPCGLGANLEGDMFFSDQQGTWIPATPIYHLRPGAFYGNQESLASLENPAAPFQLSEIPKPNQTYPEAVNSSKEFMPPAVWLPYNKMGRSATDIEVIDEDGRFGPFDGQLLVGEFTNAAISRVFLEKIEGEYQGACFPFLDGFPAAVVRLAFAPDGSLYAGMTNRGWSSLGNRSYGLSRIHYSGMSPFAMKEMKALPDGFELVFTKPVSLGSLSKGSATMISYTYEYSSSYGGDEIETQKLSLRWGDLSIDGMRVKLEVDGMRGGYVHELRLDGVHSVSGEILDYPDAYYTLNRIPKP